MNRRILLIEDDEISRDVIRSVLEGAGHLVDVAGDGFVALERMERGSYDLALLDYHLPEMDGYALGRLMLERSRVAGSALQLIGLTADRNGLAARRGSDAVFKAILAKPIEPAALCAAVGRVGAEADPASVEPVSDRDRAKATALAFWRRLGLSGLPKAFVAPSPSQDQRAALELCFDLVARPEADIALLLERHGIGEASASGEGLRRRSLPVVALSDDLGDICRAVFRVDQAESWSAVARLCGAGEAEPVPARPVAVGVPARPPEPVLIERPVAAPAPVPATTRSSESRQPGSTPAAASGITPPAADLRRILIADLAGPLEQLATELETLPDLARAGARLSAVARDLGGIAGLLADHLRPASGEPRQEPEQEAFEPGQIALDAVGMLGASLGGRINFKVSVAPGLAPSLRGDVGRIGELLTAGLDFAVFMAGEGLIRLDVGAAGPGGLRFGIAWGARPDDAARTRLLPVRLGVLDQFVVRAAAALDRPESGEALSLTVPIATIAAFTPPAATRRGAATSLLVIDPCPIGGRLLSLLLEQAGHEVVHRGSVGEALADLRRGVHDLVIVDAPSAPDALAVTAEQVALLKGIAQDVPVIAVVPALGPGQVAMLRRAGISDHLDKPINREVLSFMVDRWRRLRSETNQEIDFRPLAGEGDLVDDATYNGLVGALGATAVARLVEQLIEQVRSQIGLVPPAAGERPATADGLTSMASAASMLGLPALARLCGSFHAETRDATVPEERLSAARLLIDQTMTRTRRLKVAA